MLNQVTYPRTPQDLGHFVYQCGDIGRLTTLSVVPVVAGDSFQDSMVGSFRLSPMRRNLSLDPQLEIFSFYVPHRHIYGDDWVKFMKKGSSTPTTPNTLPNTGAVDPVGASLLGLSVDDSIAVGDPKITVSKWRKLGLEKIYQNFFVRPEDADNPPSDYMCCHLKRAWNAYAPESRDDNESLDVSGGSLSVLEINARAASYHVDQKRSLFMQRYRDIVDSFGGRTTADVDQRPTMLAHNRVFGSGYDVDGTSQDSLGQYAGRVTTAFKHVVPRFYVPEHGAIWTVALVRFAPVVNCENNFLDTKKDITYEEIACDPVLLANTPRVEHSIDNYFSGHDFGSATLPLAPMTNGNWYREHPSFVNYRFSELQGYPFLGAKAFDVNGYTQPWYIREEFYDQMFQTDQLQHWQVYAKSNARVLRSIPSSRQTLLADSNNH